MGYLSLRTCRGGVPTNAMGQTRYLCRIDAWLRCFSRAAREHVRTMSAKSVIDFNLQLTELLTKPLVQSPDQPVMSVSIKITRSGRIRRRSNVRNRRISARIYKGLMGMLPSILRSNPTINARRK